MHADENTDVRATVIHSCLKNATARPSRSVAFFTVSHRPYCYEPDFFGIGEDERLATRKQRPFVVPDEPTCRFAAAARGSGSGSG